MIGNILLLLGEIIFLGGLTIVVLFLTYFSFKEKNWLGVWFLLSVSLLLGGITTWLIQDLYKILV